MLQIIHHLFTTAALATAAPAPQPAAAPKPTPVVTPRRLANGSPACGNVAYKYGVPMACK